MANAALDTLPSSTGPVDTDVLYILEGGVSKKISVNALRALLGFGYNLGVDKDASFTASLNTAYLVTGSAGAVTVTPPTPTKIGDRYAVSVDNAGIPVISAGLHCQDGSLTEVVWDGAAWGRGSPKPRVMSFEGTFSALLTYSYGDVVMDTGGSFVCISATPIDGVATSDTDNWTPLGAL